MYRWASFIVLIIIIVVIGGFFFRIFAGFFIPLFLAAILAVVFRPLQTRMVVWLKGRRRSAALVTTLAGMLIVFVPTTVVLVLAVAEGVSMFSDISFTDVPQRLQHFRNSMGLDMPYAHDLRRVDVAMVGLIRDANSNELVDPTKIDDTMDAVRELLEVMNEDDERAHRDRLEQVLETLTSAKDQLITFDQQVDVRSAQRTFQQFKTELMHGPLWRSLTEAANPSETEQRAMTERGINALQSYLLPVGGATAAVVVRMIVGTIITAIALYFFLTDGPAMIETLMRLSPLEDRYEIELLNEFAAASRAVVLATLLAAAAQGVLASIGLWVAGVKSVFLLGLLTALFGLIPFVGASAVWLPASLWLYFFEERTWAAALLALYGALVVSQVDNLVKPLVLRGKSQLHPLLGLLSVLGGVQALGPIGILVGPMIVVCLQTLLNILHRELMRIDGRRSVKPA